MPFLPGVLDGDQLRPGTEQLVLPALPLDERTATSDTDQLTGPGLLDSRPG